MGLAQSSEIIPGDSDKGQVETAVSDLVHIENTLSVEKTEVLQTTEGETKYMEPHGTKIEVQPVEVAQSDDVVKKMKLKKKKKDAESKD